MRDLMIFSTKYCGFVPRTDCASFTVRFAILFGVRSVSEIVRYATGARNSLAMCMMAMAFLLVIKCSVGRVGSFYNILSAKRRDTRRQDDYTSAHYQLVLFRKNISI